MRMQPKKFTLEERQEGRDYLKGFTGYENLTDVERRCKAGDPEEPTKFT